MYRSTLLAIVFFIACNSTESLFVQSPKDVGRFEYNITNVGREKNTGEGYFYMIGSMHALKKRDVYAIDKSSVPFEVPNDRTIIITPPSGMNYPYSNYYQTNPASRSGANSGTTVIVNSKPDGNYGYGTKYIPNKYG